MTPIRTVEIQPPSRGAETRRVFQALAGVVFGSFFSIGLRWGDGGPRLGRELEASDLLSFQRLFRDVEPELQLAYRELQEGLIEAENARGASAAWPAPEALAAEGVPPFAAGPAGARAWTLARDGLVVSYHGRSADAPELLALIQEPVPGYSENVDPRAPPDETHHRLADGTVLHVSVWYRPAGSRPSDAPVTRPLEEGFLQILAGTPVKQVP